MKIKLLIGTLILGITLLAGACTTAVDTSTTNSPNNQVPPAPNKYLVTVSDEDFFKEANIIRQVKVKAGETFTITLDSNATTGFSWTEQATIGNSNILKQTGHQYIAPRTNDGTKPVTGMSGVEEWWFTAGQTGTTTASMSYSRPWEGGEKDARTFELTVIVE